MSTAAIPNRQYRGTHLAGLRRPSTGLAGRMAREAERRAELDRIRTLRPLTADEAAEHDRLIARLYMREWRRANASAPQVPA